MEYINAFLSLIKILLSFLNEYSNLLLVIITGIYVYLTYKTVRELRRQSDSDIIIDKENTTIGMRYLQRQLHEQKVWTNGYFRMNLIIYIRNQGIGNGSILKPYIILKNKKTNMEVKVRPITSEQKSKQVDENSYSTWTEYDEKSIFLRGKDIKIEYLEYWNSDEFCDFRTNNDYNDIEYFIEYFDFSGNKKRIEIKNIKAYDVVEKQFN